MLMHMSVVHWTKVKQYFWLAVKKMGKPEKWAFTVYLYFDLEKAKQIY